MPAAASPEPTVVSTQWAAAVPTSPDDRHSDTLRLKLRRVIIGANTPKSVESSQHGLFFVQNNVFRHTMTVYDRRFRKVKTIKDAVRLSDFGFSRYRKRVRGGPVEAAFTPDGRYAWVTQRAMYGPGFPKPPPQLGVCSPSDGYDRGSVYKIDTRRLRIVDVVRLGALPKDLSLTPDGRLLLVSNWCSYDVSVVDLATDREIRRIKVGKYPRGIAITPDSRTAYVAMLGGSRIAKIDLRGFRVRYIPGVGGAPRDAILDPSGRYMYLTLSLGDGVVKLDLRRNKVVGRVRTGDDPRSMAIAPDGRSLYLVNYGSGTVSKVRTRDMRVLQTLRAGRHPVGITYDIETRQVWVSMYPGPLRVYLDR
jgi:YVTN family beta-propeller protein